jgi:HD-like signal output (HDOD) protein
VDYDAFIFIDQGLETWYTGRHSSVVCGYCSSTHTSRRTAGTGVLKEKTLIDWSNRMDEKSLIDLVEDRLDRKDLDLPIFNQVALKLQQQITKGDYSLADIAKIIYRDQGLASDVLKIANSVFYSGIRPAKTIQDATVRLGTKAIYNLVTAVTQKQLYRTRNKKYGRWATPLWSHSLGVAIAARWLSLNLRRRQLAEEAFMAGLLHDIGKLILLKVLEDLDDPKTTPGGISADLVDEILENMHAYHGERYLRRINIPDVYSEVAGMHHDPGIDPENVIMNVTRLGNLACRKLGIGLKHQPELRLDTTTEAINLNANDHILDGVLEQLKEYNAWLEKFLA